MTNTSPTAEDLGRCTAPWCNTILTNKNRRNIRFLDRWKIVRIPVCRNCYAYIWQEAKETSKTMIETFNSSGGPQRVDYNAEKCSRHNCQFTFPKTKGSRETARLNRRMIGKRVVCRNCYQAAWDYSKKSGLSLAEAFQGLPPKGEDTSGWRDKPIHVHCCASWCNQEILAVPANQAAKDVYVCSECRFYLQKIAKRYPEGRSWQQLAVDANYSWISRPGDTKCSRCLRDQNVFSRGPKGEPICKADYIHLKNYAKKHGVTFEQAFRTAAAPIKKGPPRKP